MTLRASMRALARAIGAVTLATSLGASAGDPSIAAGERIYREGVLISGGSLTGTQGEERRVAGIEAACVRCHRPSGMGQVEGNVSVPPVNATYLLNLSTKARANMDPHVGKIFNQYHPPYSDLELARAIRDGIDNSGREMNAVMPRYALSDAEMASLIAYLKQLTVSWSPGVTADRIRFATVIAPDVDPVKRDVYVAMVKAAVSQKNACTLPGKRHMVSPAEMLLRTERQWDMEIWQLSGPPESWARQLEERYAARPVFALVSGLGGAEWGPVQQFCDNSRVPCWFPNVDMPPAATAGAYSLYFSRGVALEAEVLAATLTEGRNAPPRRIVQLARADAIGRRATTMLEGALSGAGIPVDVRWVDNNDPRASIASAVSETKSGEVLVGWLGASDIANLDKIAPTAGEAYFSAQLSSDEKTIPNAWRRTARLIYPYELPERRAHHLDYFHYWLKSRGIPLVDEAMQSQTYFALTFLTDTLADMLDNLYRDYLVERAELMINRRETSRAEEEARDRPNLGYRSRYSGNRTGVAAAQPIVGVSLAPVAVGVAHGTTIYPRLTLAPGQRYAARGAYIARFADDASARLLADSDWVVPRPVEISHR